MSDRNNRSREKEAAMRVLLERYRASGQTQAEFCREAGIHAQTLWYWEKRLNGAAAPTAPFFKLTEERCHTAPTAEAAVLCELVAPNGWVVRFYGDAKAPSFSLRGGRTR